MIFAILFFASFVIGLIAFIATDRWWLGGVFCAVGLMLVTLSSFSEAALQGVALYFGIPIVFFGSLFGAYIVQLRRAPEIDELAQSDMASQNDDPADHSPSDDENQH